jgi:hypothetical protein
VAVHVDVIKNEWLAGTQHRLAWVETNEAGHVTVHGDQPDHWRLQLERIIGHALEGSGVLNELHEKLSGTALSATEPHDSTSCPFRDAEHASLQGTPVPDPPRVGAR